MAQFINLAPGDDTTAFFASDLTREHLREVVRFFISSEQSGHLVPFQRLGTGAINMLVFALLTFIAELKEKQSVIFAMEEPEIALPPHTQRRVVQFVLREMGQTLVTSHSPYVIERFEPQQIVILERDMNGTLSGTPVDIQDIKPKTFKTERRQFAEAVLSRAVLVVEGGTEAAIFSAASTVLEDALGSDNYTHFDLAGVTVFDARGAGEVPRFGTIFKSLGKTVFGFYDKLAAPLTPENTEKLVAYTQCWESPDKGVEDLLVAQTPVAVLRRFLDEVKDRLDYPSHPQPAPAMSDTEITELARKVLKDRKGDVYAYGALLIMQCASAEELPATIRKILEDIHTELTPVQPGAMAQAEATDANADTAVPDEAADPAPPQDGTS